MALNSIEEIIADLRDGRMVIMMDDEDRENEGDFVVAASHCTAEDVNFMAMHGRGLICMTLTESRCRQLNLPLMVQETMYSHATNFTVSIEAAVGVTTGISAADRARTIQAAVAPDAVPQDLKQPGHVFPLMAQNGGVLTRAADLIRFRIENEKTVNRVAEATLPTEFGDFRLITYRDDMHRDVHFAMVRGEVNADEPTLVRVHIHNPLEDLTASVRPDAGWPLRDALRRVADADSGVVVVLSNQISSDELVQQVTRYADESAEMPSGAGGEQQRTVSDWRQVGLGAQILADVGVRKMLVMSNPRKYHAISGFGLEVVEYVK